MRRGWARRSTAVAAALAVLLGVGAADCDKRPPRITVVEFTASATIAGFHWTILIQGGNYRKRSGFEPTLDMAAQRLEVVEGKDIRVEFTVTSKHGAVVRCQLRSRALAKGSATGGGGITCQQNVSAILDDEEYP